MGALDVLLRASSAECAGRTFLVAAPTFPMLRDSALAVCKELGDRLGLLRSMNKSEMRATLSNGATVLFRSTDEPERLRGPNLSGAWLDEASLMTREAHDITIACLREGGKQGWLSATFTPKGRSHWTYETFASAKPDTELVQARTAENPFLPEGFVDRLRQQYTSFVASQELEGAFVDPEGALFRRSWFEIVDKLPQELLCVRSWDIASRKQKPGTDPDWTVGLLIGRQGNQGNFYITDVRRARETPQGVEDMIVGTANLDGRHVHVELPQDPGAAGVIVADHYARLLAGFKFRAENVTGDKATRALPLAASAEVGHVKLLRGAWNKDFLDEVESFPLGDHDDQVDAASSGFNRLTELIRSKYPMRSTWKHAVLWNPNQGIRR